MTDALRYEWVRIRTLRSTYWLTGLALLLPAVVSGLVAALLPDRVWDNAPAGVDGAIVLGGVMFTPLPFTAIFMGLIGAFAMGHEYRHGTILSTLAALPRRHHLLLAKLLVVTVWTLVVTVFGLALNWGLASVLSGREIDPFAAEILPAVIGYTLYVLLWGILGLAGAALLRSLPVIVTLLFVVPLIVEPLIEALFLFMPGLDALRGVPGYLPFTAGLAMTTTLSLNDIGALFGGAAMPEDSGPSRWVSGLTFAGWTAVLLGAGWFLFRKRDA